MARNQYILAKGKNIEYIELFTKVIRVSGDKFPFMKSRQYIKDMVSGGNINRFVDRKGHIRYKPTQRIIIKRQVGSAPIPPPQIPPRWEFIGISEEVGFGGFKVYFDPDTDSYVTVDPTTNNAVKTNTDLAIELIASIDTKGHEGETRAEIRVRGTMKGGLGKIEGTEKELQKKLDEWIKDNTAVYSKQKGRGGMMKNTLISAGFAPKMMSKLQAEVDSRIKEGRRIMPTNNSEPVSGMFEYKNRKTDRLLWESNI